MNVKIKIFLTPDARIANNITQWGEKSIKNHIKVVDNCVCVKLMMLPKKLVVLKLHTGDNLVE